MLKNFKLNKQQFNTLEHVFYIYLKNNPEDQQALKLAQDFIDQAIDNQTY